MIGLFFGASTTAHAGGPIMSATTFISGTDRSDGVVYGDPKKDGRFYDKTVLDVAFWYYPFAMVWPYEESWYPHAAQAQSLPVYKGDSVTFRFLVQNWDPYPGWGGQVKTYSYYTGGKMTGGVANFAPKDDSFFKKDVKFSEEQFDNSVTGFGIITWRIFDIAYELFTGEPLLHRPECVDNAANCFLQDSSGKELTLTVKATGTGVDTPGNKFCAYIETNPTIQDYTTFLIPTVLGSKKFNHESGDNYYADASLERGYEVVRGLIAQYIEAPIYGVPAAVINPNASVAMLTGTIPENIVRLNKQMSCAEIAYVYNLIPTISVSDGSGGANYNVSPGIKQGQLPKDAPGATYTKKTKWQVSQFYLPESNFANPPKLSESNLDPCQYYVKQYKAKDCAVPKNGNASANSNGFNTIFNADGSFKSGSAFPLSVNRPKEPDIGYVLCYALSVNAYAPYIKTDVAWRNSDVVCMEGSKHPKVNIYGGDVLVGGAINTSVDTYKGDSGQMIFGSWGEYASFSGKGVVGFATKSGLQGGVDAGYKPTALSMLTFANVANGARALGNYSNNLQTNAAKDIRQLFSAAQKGVPVSGVIHDLGSIKDARQGKKISGNLEIKGGNISAGQTIVLVVDGDVNITGNITYDSSKLRSIADIPQVVIVANTINVDDSVTNLDAWLVAGNDKAGSGIVNTCLSKRPGDPLTKKVCNNQLVVNGPVATDRLYLLRTYGAERSNPEVPAEIINVNAASILWASGLGNTSNAAATTYQLEVSPRF